MTRYEDLYCEHGRPLCDPCDDCFPREPLSAASGFLAHVAQRLPSSTRIWDWGLRHCARYHKGRCWISETPELPEMWLDDTV